MTNRFFLCFFCALLVLQVPANAQSLKWIPVQRDVEYCTYSDFLFGRQASISAVRYKMNRRRTHLLNANGPLADSTSALALGKNALAAVNCSYFNVGTLEPVTFVKERGRQIASTTAREAKLRVDGILAIDCCGRVSIFPADTLSDAALCRKYPFAIASGPVLLQNGSPVKPEWPKGSFFSRHHPRTIVGTDAEGRMCWIVVDGRFPGQGEGASIDEAVAISQMFGLQDAINLDGGGSCTLWVRGEGVLSHPYDNHRFDHYGQRQVPNILYIR